MLKCVVNIGYPVKLAGNNVLIYCVVLKVKIIF